MLRNNTHVILALSDWLRLVSSSATGQWGSGVVCAPLLRCYKAAAMRDERRNSDSKRHHTYTFAALLCVFTAERHLDLQSYWTEDGAALIVPEATDSGRMSAPRMLHTGAPADTLPSTAGEADSDFGMIHGRTHHFTMT